jgi:hypothetical protein
MTDVDTLFDTHTSTKDMLEAQKKKMEKIPWFADMFGT